MTALPPFSGDSPRCAKCGHEGAGTRYMAWDTCDHLENSAQGGVDHEFLHRWCSRCGFPWDEALPDLGEQAGVAS